MILLNNTLSLPITITNKFQVKGRFGALHAVLRSTKYNDASAATRYSDLQQLRAHPDFRNAFYDAQDAPKQLMVILPDGSTEGNPR